MLDVLLEFCLRFMRIAALVCIAFLQNDQHMNERGLTNLQIVTGTAH